ncbi:MAG: quinone-dependent dihydroorotate dehydrogenase [Kastovskya adunca ATA6-11-RM4]|jgi:dihydroorotate dehydrogenase|nr:quinone-dependent dihydroorotate dehydrogenase [Kastovskya adunca ATA6-11-RM4]
MDIYQAGIRPILFSGLKADPEWVHRQTLQVLGWLDHNSDRFLSRRIQAQLEQAYCLRHACLEQTLWGLTFPNPLGLAAGFDKDGVAAGIWSAFGFGFAELGTVTFQAQPGNPRPRLFRLPADLAALNRMGFNNQGSAVIAAELAKRQERPRVIPLGINLGKSKVTPLSDAPADYLGSFRLLKEWGDYFVINVSSPNTPGLRSLQDAEQLSRIVEALQEENQLLAKPILVKIAPDLEWEAIADVIKLAQTYQLAGIIATNTTIRRDMLKTQQIAATGKPVTEEAGGISGAPLRQRSTEVIRFIWQQTNGQLPIVGVGGIFTAEDAWEKITAGASLIQVYTGWVYEGPSMVRQVLEGLVQRLEERGLNSIAEAVGIENTSI